VLGHRGGVVAGDGDQFAPTQILRVELELHGKLVPHLRLQSEHSRD